MKKLIVVFLWFIAGVGYGQVSNPSIISVSTAPSGSCSAGLPNQQVVSTGTQYSCQNVTGSIGTWAALAGGGGGGVISINTVSGAFTFTGSGVSCTSTTCTFTGGTSTPALSYPSYPLAVCVGQVGFSAAPGTYGSNQPQFGCVNPTASGLGYALFAATPVSPQYAEIQINLDPFWTGNVGGYFTWYSSSTSGNAVIDIQTACPTGGIAGSPTFNTAVTTTQAVNGVANTIVQTALISPIAAPGANGCPSGTITTPTALTVRIYADATSAVPVYGLKFTPVFGRTQ